MNPKSELLARISLFSTSTFIIFFFEIRDDSSESSPNLTGEIVHNEANYAGTLSGWISSFVQSAKQTVNQVGKWSFILIRYNRLINKFCF